MYNPEELPKEDIKPGENQPGVVDLEQIETMEKKPDYVKNMQAIESQQEEIEQEAKGKGHKLSSGGIKKIGIALISLTTLFTGCSRYEAKTPDNPYIRPSAESVEDESSLVEKDNEIEKLREQLKKYEKESDGPELKIPEAAVPSHKPAESSGEKQGQEQPKEADIIKAFSFFGFNATSIGNGKFAVRIGSNEYHEVDSGDLQDLKQIQEEYLQRCDLVLHRKRFATASILMEIKKETIEKIEGVIRRSGTIEEKNVPNEIKPPERPEPKRKTAEEIEKIKARRAEIAEKARVDKEKMEASQKGSSSIGKSKMQKEIEEEVDDLIKKRIGKKYRSIW